LQKTMAYAGTAAIISAILFKPSAKGAAILTAASMIPHLYPPANPQWDWREKLCHGLLRTKISHLG